MKRRLRRWLGAPALHFAALGLLGFALFGGGGRPDAEPPVREPIVVTAPQIEAMLARYALATGLRPGDGDARTLVAREVDEEILYREAVALGLHHEDRGVKWRMIEKMTFLSDDHDTDRQELLAAAVDLDLTREDPVVRRILVERMRLVLQHRGDEESPTQAALEAYRLAHRERFEHPMRLRLSQVFVSAERHPETLDADAASLSAILRGEAVDPARAMTFSDPFPTAGREIWAIRRELAARFGEGFAAEVETLAPGAWSEPIPSPFGRHVVFVHERLAARLPPLAEIVGPVSYGLAAEERRRAFEAGMERLRRRYEVRIEWPEAVIARSDGARP